MNKWSENKRIFFFTLLGITLFLFGFFISFIFFPFESFAQLTPQNDQLPADWGIIGTSLANTSLTVTKAAETDLSHYITGLCVGALGATVPNVEVNLQEGTSDFLRVVLPNVGQTVCVPFTRPLMLAPSRAAKLVIPAAGLGVITVGSFWGYTR